MMKSGDLVEVSYPGIPRGEKIFNTGLRCGQVVKILNKRLTYESYQLEGDIRYSAFWNTRYLKQVLIKKKIKIGDLLDD